MASSTAATDRTTSELKEESAGLLLPAQSGIDVRAQEVVEHTVATEPKMFKVHQTSCKKAIASMRLGSKVTAQARFLSSLRPSTLDEGFRLAPTRLENPFDSDLAYKRVLAWYLPSDVLDNVAPRLRTFGDEAVSDQVHEWISNAETQQPYIKTRDLFNNRHPYDRLVTSHGWKELGRWGISNG